MYWSPYWAKKKKRKKIIGEIYSYTPLICCNVLLLLFILPYDVVVVVVVIIINIVFGYILPVYYSLIFVFCFPFDFGSVSTHVSPFELHINCVCVCVSFLLVVICIELLANNPIGMSGMPFPRVISKFKTFNAYKYTCMDQNIIWQHKIISTMEI